MSYVDPKKRKNKFSPRRKRKLEYPDDETLVRMINFTNITLAASMIGVTKETLRRYLLIRHLDDQLYFYWHQRFMRRKRANQAKEKAQLLELLFL